VPRHTLAAVTIAPPPPALDGRAPAPSLDALMPREMAIKASAVGVQKAGLSALNTFVLGVLAGAFIGLGAMFATVVGAGAQDLPFGIVRLLSGIAFSLGLILVVVAGAELFTGNNLIVMAWAERRVPVRRLLRNWGLVYAGNFVGSLATALLVFAAKQYAFGNGSVGLNALKIAETKTGLGFGQAIALGILCNALVCLAVWLCYSARGVADKVLAIIFPITAFVAAGFEHSVANMYFLPQGLMIRNWAPDSFWRATGSSASAYPHVTVGHALLGNLLPVTIGNIFGGAVMVGLVYWLVYLRGTAPPTPPAGSAAR
jgi:formate transporter